MRVLVPHVKPRFNTANLVLLTKITLYTSKENKIPLGFEV